MKVFFVSTNQPDYQADTIFHGLYSLLGSDFTYNGSYDMMYKTHYAKEQLLGTSGKGFTMWGDLDENLNDNSDIEQKIKSHYFDYIIYGSFRRSLDYYDLVSTVYDKKHVIFVDGEDDQHVYDTQGHPLFKRELTQTIPNVFPISFGMPSHKVTKSIPEKTKKLADYKPSAPGTGYVYNKEEDYYNNYKEALYGLTHKKAGWDCMRHYEILGNYCIPYFPDIDHCPDLTMNNFPKDIVKRTNQLFEQDCDEQKELLEKLFNYTKENLVCEAIVKHMFNVLK